MKEDLLGWYHIDAKWKLYISGVLQTVFVQYVRIDKETNGDDYLAKHFGRSGKHITTVTVTAEDIETTLSNYGKTDKPTHIV